MVDASIDATFIDRALLLAERGRGRTSPNPLVGAVVVSSTGTIVGEGAHEIAGGPHAEVIALDAASDAASGATLYCTLEPCSHFGRTGPCATRIAEAKIARVVASMVDPNPLVSGNGFNFLRASGIDVSVGVGEARARALNAPFITWVTKGRPFVTAKTVVSADGFVGVMGERTLLSGEDANRLFHAQRAEVDAIAVGADTVIVDDPQLTARLFPRSRPLTRVIVDWRLRVSPAARVFSTVSEGPVIIVARRPQVDAPSDKVDALKAAGATIEVFEQRDLLGVLRRLASLDITWLLLEGGPALQQAFFEASLVDRVQRLETRVRLEDGVREAAGFRETRPDGGVRTREIGSDCLLEWDVHRTD